MTVQVNSNVLRLAFCALVCMFALQVWEVSHDHAHAGAALECQVCNSPADLALPAPAVVAPVAVAFGQLRERSSHDGLNQPYPTFNSRAPPTHS